MDKFGIERPGSDNYESWSFQMKNLLMREEQWKFVTEEMPEPVTEVWKTKNDKAQGTISLFVGIMQQSLIQNCTTAKQIWETLKDLNQKTSLTSKVPILKRIVNMTYGDCDDMELHLHEMEDLFQRLSNTGLELGATLKVVLVHRSIPASYQALTLALESRPEVELTMEAVKRKLIDEALKRNERSVPGESLLRAETGPKRIVCYRCDKPRHMKRDRRLGVQKRTDGKQKEFLRQPKQKARVVKEFSNASFAFIVNQHLGGAAVKDWLIDSGASSHMCSDEYFFKRIDQISGMSVTLADWRVADVTGKGCGNLCQFFECFVRPRAGC